MFSYPLTFIWHSIYLMSTSYFCVIFIVLSWQILFTNLFLILGNYFKVYRIKIHACLHRIKYRKLLSKLQNHAGNDEWLCIFIKDNECHKPSHINDNNICLICSSKIMWALFCNTSRLIYNREDSHVSPG